MILIMFFGHECGVVFLQDGFVVVENSVYEEEEEAKERKKERKKNE